MTPRLETEQLVLRPLARTDAPRIQLLFPTWNVVKWLAAVIPWPYPDNGAESFLDMILPQIEGGTKYAWAIALRSDIESQLIGIIELTPDHADDNRGFWLGEAYQGRGYMTEAVAAVTDFAFDVLEMESLLLSNAEPNCGSHRLKEKAGAEIIEVCEDVGFVSGSFRRVRWKLTRESWRKNRTSFLSG